MEASRIGIKRQIILMIFVAWAIVMLNSAVCFPSSEITLAEGGEAQFPIIVGPGASTSVQASANELADYLERITNAQFKIVKGDGQAGIAVGIFTDFPELNSVDFQPNDISGREAYILRTHSAGVYMIGATEIAVQHAVWDFLHRLGYRQFFPTETWEVVPTCETLTVSLDVCEQPDYYNRMGPRVPPWTDQNLWAKWHERNRMTPAFTLNTGHAYNSIYSANVEEFAQHPEYLALVDGVRTAGNNVKFCISNPGLRQLIVKHALAVFQANPALDSISMDPSDGKGYCECSECAAMGSISDQVVFLANTVAEAVNQVYPNKYVGIYAYGSYSPPPNIDVHPNVIISIATAFIRGGYTLQELVEGWGKKASLLGVREYHDVHLWSWGKPQSARGGNISYLAEKIPYFHRHGARFMNSESSDSWGANGLGYYLSARLLWNVDEDPEEIIDDFLEKAFGAAKEPMRAFYDLILDYQALRLKEDLVARMYRHLADAYSLNEDPKVKARIDELVLYTRYLELLFAYEAAGVDCQLEAEALYRHAYRMRNTMMMHMRGLYVALQREIRGGKNCVLPEEADPGHLNVGAPSQDYEPWKSSIPFTDTEIAAILADGIANNQVIVLDFEPVFYSDELVPAAELNLPEVAMGNFGIGFRGVNKMYTWFTPAEQELLLTVQGGLITWYQDRGNVRVRLLSPLEETGEPVDIDESVPPDATEYQIVLQTPYEGLHMLEWSDGGDRTMIKWPSNWPMSLPVKVNEAYNPSGRWTVYFYVPKGTTIVGGYTDSSSGSIRDGAGNTVFDFTKMESAPGFFSVAVPEGQDGTLWKFHSIAGSRILLTVPPYVARNGKELLLPIEVVEADK